VRGCGWRDAGQDRHHVHVHVLFCAKIASCHCKLALKEKVTIVLLPSWAYEPGPCQWSLCRRTHTLKHFSTVEYSTIIYSTYCRGMYSLPNTMHSLARDNGLHPFSQIRCLALGFTVKRYN